MLSKYDPIWVIDDDWLLICHFLVIQTVFWHNVECLWIKLVKTITNRWILNLLRFQVSLSCFGSCGASSENLA